jgi:hypothetical protein
MMGANGPDDNPIRRKTDGLRFEIRMLTGFGYVALGGYPTCLRLAAASSLFLTLFGLSLGSKPALFGCFGFYAAAGVGWLAVAYRISLRTDHPTDADAIVSPADPGRVGGRVPWGLAGVTAVSFALATAITAAADQTLSLANSTRTASSTAASLVCAA